MSKVVSIKGKEMVKTVDLETISWEHLRDSLWNLFYSARKSGLTMEARAIAESIRDMSYKRCMSELRDDYE